MSYRIEIDMLFRFSALVCLLNLSVPAQSTVALGSQPLKKAIEAAKFPEDDRVAKGIPISIGLVPWQVALVAAEIRVNSKAQFCGGIIVGSRWILTAAHCVDEGTRANQVEILIGTDTLISGGRRVTIVPNGIRIHEKWKPPSHNFDIALIQASEDLTGKNIESLPIAKGDLTKGQMIMVSGWGRLAYTDSAGSPVLLAAEVPYVPSETCNKPASYRGKITKNMFCAGKDEGGQDACRGDSGGPATISVDGERKLLGVISWGEGCGSPKKYGVYSRVAEFRSWIIEQTEGDISF